MGNNYAKKFKGRDRQRAEHFAFMYHDKLFLQRSQMFHIFYTRGYNTARLAAWNSHRANIRRINKENVKDNNTPVIAEMDFETFNTLLDKSVNATIDYRKGASDE